MILKGPPQPSPRCATLVEALARAAATDTGIVFVGLDETERRVPWREVQARASRLADALVARGVRHGDRVALVLRTGPEFPTAFFGALVAGAVPVPLYPPLRLGRLDEYRRVTTAMLRTAGARLVVSDGVIASLLGEVVLAARPDLGLLDVADLESRSGDGFDFRAAPTRMSGAKVKTVPEDLALVQFSSGTTVAPKPVALTHANLIAMCASLREVLAPAAPALDPVGVSWLPLYHDMGLIGFLLEAAYWPGEVVLIPPEHFLARPSLWLRTIARHRGFVTAAPSFAYALCARKVRDEDLAAADLSCLRMALDGAESVSTAAIRDFVDRFARFGLDPRCVMPVYGLAEASLAVSFSPRGRAPVTRAVDGRDVVSVGTPVPGVEVAVVDGEIRVRGPAVMAGYLGDPAATARAFDGDWLRTGDLGAIVDGELHVTGRAKDLVVVRGANHAPETFEAAATGVDGVRAGCVVACGFVPDGAGGEELALFVESRAPDRERVVAAVRAAVAAATGVRAHTVVMLAPGTLPRTSSGKLRRGETLRRWRAGTLDPPRRHVRIAVAVALARSLVARLRLAFT